MASSATVAMVTMTSTVIAHLALLCVVGMLLTSATHGAKLGRNRYDPFNTRHMLATEHLDGTHFSVMIIFIHQSITEANKKKVTGEKRQKRNRETTRIYYYLNRKFRLLRM